MATPSRLRLYFVNGLTLSRFVFAALFVYLVSIDQWVWVLVLGPIAFATDLVDGKLARHWQVSSSFGKFIDPLSDKVLTLTLLWLAVAYYDFAPIYSAAAFIISVREISMTVVRLTNKKKTGNMAGASRLAKYKTMIIMQTLLLLLLAIVLERAERPSQLVEVLSIIWLGASLVVALWSWYGYRHLYGLNNANQDSSKAID